MEDDLGLGLFNRHNRKVELTKSGKYLQEELIKNIKNLEHIFSHAKLLNDGIGGDLKFGYVGSAIQKIIPNLLLQFRKEHPDVVFNLKEMDNQRQIENLLSHDIDMGFVRLERVPRDLAIVPVLKETFCLVLHRTHPISKENFKSLSQLKDESFILFDPKYSSSYFEKVMQIFDESNFTPIISHNTIHASSIYKLVENRFGISIVPKSLKSNHKGIKFIELDMISQRTVLSAVWNTKNKNPVLQKTIKLLHV
jgi:DNA-binding transcriptional LysR family regulator